MVPPQPSKNVTVAALDLIMEDINKSSINSAFDCEHISYSAGTLQKADEEIRRFLTAAAAFQKEVDIQLARCRRRRNLLTSTILQCPDEIISEILQHSAKNEFHRNYYRHLHNLGLVCTRFHQISEGTYRLWSYINNEMVRMHSKDHSLVTMLLAKSKNAPLDIKLYIELYDYSMNLLNLTLPHSHRWEAFQCTFELYSGASSKWAEAVEASVECCAILHAPLLNRFVVEVKGPRFLSRRLDILSGSAPFLRHLDILPITISWDSPILTGLTFLRISAWDGIRTPTADQYMLVLSSCPLLEELHVIGRDSDCTAEKLAASFHSNISLPGLKKISLCILHPLTIRSLLFSIKADPVSLEVVFPSNYADQWREVLETTLMGDPGCDFLPKFIWMPTTMVFKYDYWEEVRVLSIELRTDFNDDSGYHFGCAFKDFPVLINIYRTVLPPSSKASIKTLSIRIEDGYFSDDFGPRQLLEELIGLEVLQLVTSRIELWPLLSALTVPMHIPSTSQPTSERVWLCPQLRSLTIRNVDFELEPLLDFLLSRYRCVHADCTTSSLVPLSFLQVMGNGMYYDDYDDDEKLPLEIAFKIADIVGINGFLWEDRKLRSSDVWTAA